MESRREFLKKATLLGSTAAVGGLAAVRSVLAEQDEEREQLTRTIGELIIQDMQGQRKDDPVELYKKLGGTNQTNMQILKKVFGTRTRVEYKTASRLSRLRETVIEAEREIAGVGERAGKNIFRSYSILEAAQAKVRLNR